MLTQKGIGGRGNIKFTCNECGEVLDTDLQDLTLARIILQDEGWRTRKVDNDWHHYCEDCEDGDHNYR